MKDNYQLILNKTIDEIKNLDYKPKLLLHVCCAPCSSYVLDYLSSYFNISLFFYNPNIAPKEEYDKRIIELDRFVNEFNNSVKIIEGNYDNNIYEEMIKGLEEEKEGGKRCFKCFNLRLEETAKKALELNFDYFTTTLSISPYKNASVLNSIGKNLENEYKIKYLYSDFKKNDGYKKSIELSKKYQLYRQDYCGCTYSRKREYSE
jgi:predicted adenine nucleotide alpha hydrolase (AANH) superfamily ATPase